MFGLAIDIDKFTPLSNVINGIFIEIKLIAQLVKIGNLQIRTQLNATGLRLQLTQNQLEQGTFTRPVGSH